MKLQPHDWMDVNKEKSSRVWCRAGLSVPSEAGSFSVHFSVYRSLTPLKDTGGRIPKSGKAKHRNGIGGWETGGVGMEKAKVREMMGFCMFKETERQVWTQKVIRDFCHFLKIIFCIISIKRIWMSYIFNLQFLEYISVLQKSILS